LSRLAVHSSKIAAMLMAACAIFGGTAAAQTPPSAIFTVAKVAVKAEASDAVKAKQLAIVSGQKQALETLMLRLTGFSAHGSLPQIEDAAVQRLITGMQVRDERNSATVYLATLDFTFAPDAVKTLLDQFGVAYVVDRAPEVQVLPIYLEGGVVKPGDRNPWVAALAKRDLRNGLTPVKLNPPRADLPPAQVAAVAADPAKSFQSLQSQIKGGKLVLAVVEVDAAATMLTLKLAGQDASGPVKLERHYKILDGEIGESAEEAAKVTLGTLEGRWKLVHLASEGELSGPQELSPVALTAQFAGLKEWQSIRAKLQKLPGMQNLNVMTVNPRGATVSLEYPGGAEHLAKAAANEGMVLEGGEGAWVLHLR
jgi:hypothetical protein